MQSSIEWETFYLLSEEEKVREAMGWLPNVRGARTTQGDILLLLDFLHGDGSLMKEHKSAAAVESCDSSYVPLVEGLSHEAVALFSELSGRSS